MALVEPDYKVHVQWRPNDTNFSLQWHHPIIGTEAAWDVNTGSDVVKVRGRAACGARGGYVLAASHRSQLAAAAGCPQSPAAANLMLRPLSTRQVCHVDSGVRVDHPDLAPNVLKGWNFVPAGQVSCGAHPPLAAGGVLHGSGPPAPAALPRLATPPPLALPPRALPPSVPPVLLLMSQVEGTPPPRAGTPDYFNYNDTYGHGTHTAGGGEAELGRRCGTGGRHCFQRPLCLLETEVTA